MKKIFVHCNLPILEVQNLKKYFKVIVHNADKKILNNEIFLKRASGFDGIITQGNEVNKKFLEENKNKLKAISNVAVGYDNIDVKVATKLGIPVFNTPAIMNLAVADMTLGLILSAARKICSGNNFVKEGKWRGNSWPLFLGSDLYNETLGIVGMGNIGKEVAKRASSFGLKIFYNNRKRLDRKIEKKYNAFFLGFNELISKCKFIVLLLPLNDESKYLFNKRTFKKMRNDSFLINVARGKIVKEIDLVNAIIKKEIEGAALDVFEYEPEVNKELFKLDNVVLMPHAGSATLETRKNMIKLACRNISDFFLLNSNKNVVNKEVLNV